MKKSLLLILMFMLLGVSFGSAYAASHPTAGVVNTRYTDLNLRSGAGTSHGVIAKLSDGTHVKILSVNGNWYKVSVNGKTGYCYKSYIKVTEREEVDYSSLPKKEQEKIGRDLDKSAAAANLATTVAE